MILLSRRTLSAGSVIGRFLARHVGDQVAERQVDVLEVIAPVRTEDGRDRGPRIARSSRDLQPGGTAALLALGRIEVRVRHPRGAQRDMRYRGGGAEEVWLQSSALRRERHRVDA